MFTGIFPPIPTPFQGDEIAFDRLAANLDRWNSTGLAGLVVLGSNGEFVLLDEKEKRDLIAFVRERTPRDRRVIVGTGCESTRATINLTRAAARLGADGALVVNPSYYKESMTEAVLERFYRDVADASPIPVMLYNMPRNTGINLSTGLILRLAEHPNIVGIKDSGGNIVQISEVIAGAPEGFSVFAGSGSFLLPLLVMGGAGGTLAVANVVPDVCVAIYRHFQAGELEEARALQRRILDLNRAVTAGYGVAGLKAALDLVGYYGGAPRPPLLPVGNDARARIRQILADGGFLPAGG